jgi:O-glycosyl hydrolase
MQFAQARGARVWSSPWSPAVQFKSNGNVNGGSFLGNDANYQAYASQLAGYVAKMKNTYGINLYALSIQNEPDANVTTYESCNWTAQQIHDFVPYLYSALVASNVAATKIMLPESQNWPDYQGLVTTTMNDPVVATNVGIIADHNYDGATGPGSLAKNSYGKALWETEVSLLSGSGSSIYNGVYWAGRIHAYMTVAQANAWHHWWLISGNTTANQGLFDSAGNPTKRMYVMGNFSRFVRPNFNRIGVVTNSGNAVVSAYKDPSSGRFAIVAINTNPTNSINLTLNLTNFTAGSVTPWVTSRSLSLASQSAVAVSNSSFTYALPGPSVVTFVGQGDVAPTNISLSNSSVSENQPPGIPVGSLSTADPDSGNTFDYTLAGGTGGADNASFTITNNTLYTTAIFDVAVQSGFNIRVRSTDQNGLWVEKLFNITVTPDSQARKVLNVTAAPDGNWTLTFAGIPGYVYRVQAASDLTPPIVWATLTDNFNGGVLFTADASGLWMHVDLNSTNYPSRFYRTVEP